MKFQKKILVIEDDQNLGIAIQNILSLHHFDVCYANNGASGIQQAYKYNPDLILCDIKMDPVDGYQVYKVLDESSMLVKIPFIFLSESGELEEIRFGMALGADDYLVKPFKNEDLIRSINKRLEKFQIIRDDATREFNRLFNIYPFALFLSDGNRVFKVNHAFLKQIQNDSTIPAEMKIDDFIEQDSIQKLKVNIREHQPDKTEIFNEEVTIKTVKGEELQMKLVVSEFEKFSNYTLYIGLFILPSKSIVPRGPNRYADEVHNLLRLENIRISPALGEKIINIFKQKTLNLNNQKNTFFTKRENEVLCLSMEGLPIKTIADRLGISDRTVEKHRTKLIEKSGANNMIEVIVFALKNSLIEI